MGLLVTAVAVLVTGVALLVLAVLALREAWRAHRSPTSRRSHLGRVVSALGGCLLLVGGLLVAGPIAEAKNEWVDRDGNGILDPFDNGGYDWVDINGGAWGGVVLFADAAVLIAVAIGFRGLGESAQ